MFATIEQHLGAYLSKVDASVHEHLKSFVAWVTDEEGKIATEVADLKAKGMTVLKNGVEL